MRITFISVVRIFCPNHNYKHFTHRQPQHNYLRTSQGAYSPHNITWNFINFPEATTMINKTSIPRTKQINLTYKQHPLWRYVTSISKNYQRTLYSLAWRQIFLVYFQNHCTKIKIKCCLLWWTKCCDVYVFYFLWSNFQCVHICDRKCIEDDEVCDGTDDCSDGRDELNCPIAVKVRVQVLNKILFHPRS